MMVHRDNLIVALTWAIQTREQQEFDAYGPNFQSALVAGWIELRDNLSAGDDIVFHKES